MRYLYIALLVSLVAIFQTGCAAKQNVEPIASLSPIPICQKDLRAQFSSASSEEEVESLLTEAEQGGCWEHAYLESLKAQAAISEKQLAKGLKHFNRQQSGTTFDEIAAKYLTALVDGRIAYGDEQQRWLEAYSRYSIRNARSQNSQQLRLVQQVCWRLDRPLYTRLFD